MVVVAAHHAVDTVDARALPMRLACGDFGDRPSDYEFSGNGLVFADRKPTPKAQEVKQLYSNVHIDVAEDSVTIKNDNLFTSTGEYTFGIPARRRSNGQR